MQSPGSSKLLVLAAAVLLLVVYRVAAVVDAEDEPDPEELNAGSLEANGTGAEVPVGRTLMLLHLLKQKLQKLHQLDRITTTPYPFPGCICVPYYLCSVNNTIITDGSGVIDVRYRRCTGDLEVCCFPRPSSIVLPTVTLPTVPPTIPTTRMPPPTIATTTTTPRPPPPPTIPTTMRTTPIPATIPTTRPTTTAATIPTTRPTTTAATIPTTRPTIPMTSQSLPLTYPYPVAPVCTCVPIYQCPLYAGYGGGYYPGVVPGLIPGVVPGVIPGGTIDGAGIINPRQQAVSTCVGLLVCCNYSPNALPVPSVTFPPFTLPYIPPTTTAAPPIVIPPVVLPPIVYGQSCICMLVTACNIGYIPISGAGNIDPRLILGRQGQPVGSCGASNSMCCKLTPDTLASQFNAIVPQVSALAPQVNFNSPQFNAVAPQPNAAAPQVNVVAPNSIPVGDIKNPGTANACTCLPAAQCADDNAVTYDGVGAIDPRFGPCASSTLVCCRLTNRQRTDVVIGISTGQSPAIVSPLNAIVNSQQSQTLVTCGTRETTYANQGQQTPGTAYFAEFPWMVLLLVRQQGTNDVLQCGGSLISSRAVLTAAHCVTSCDPGTLIARLGEWNTQTTNEPLPFQEVNAQAIIVHPQFRSGPLYHDVAIVALARPVMYAVNVRPVCMPAQGQVYAAGTTCFASGWGRSAFGAGGQYQTTLRKVDLPIVDNGNCQTRLRLTRLGQFFQLHPSFICAGGEASKDTCYKDGGGPLVCADQTGKFTQVGIISWGIGCGDSTPAVYASVAQHRQWIDQTLLTYGL